jgi:hypothetical protein
VGVWLVVYVVGAVCTVCTVRGAGFSDAATLEDAIGGFLRSHGIRPESLTITGPYAGVQTSGLPIELEDG